MTPEETKKTMDNYLRELEQAIKSGVKVGLPSDKVGDKIYGDGTSIMQIGAGHEYGTEHMPARSFLRMPFDLKRKEIDGYIGVQFQAVLTGTRTANDALELIGIKAVNISREAFRSNGFWQWADLADSTVKIKEEAGKTTVLVWSGILRNAITWSIEK
jgi:hypothetical protein